MKVTVIGASGGSGFQLAKAAQQSEHHVTAVVRNPRRLTGHHFSAVATADILNAGDIKTALSRHDAVAFCVGPRKGESKTILQDGIPIVLQTMGDLGIRRLIAISSSGHLVNNDDPVGRFIAKPILGLALKDINADLAAMEKLIHSSDTDWTVVRPPRLLNSPAKGHYRQRRDGNVHWRYSITRGDLAQAMLDFLEDQSTVGHNISVAN